MGISVLMDSGKIPGLTHIINPPLKIILLFLRRI